MTAATDGLAVGISASAALLRNLPDAVEEWNRMGYRSAWTSEVAGPDFATLLGAVAAASRPYGGLELGVGVAPVQTRAPWLLAASGASLATLSGKPFNLGLGASSPLIVEDWSGGEWTLARTRVRETVQVLRQAFAGERTDFQGRTTCSRRYRLPWTPDAAVRVLVGATGPHSLHQAGAIADGVVLNMIGPEHVPALLADVHVGAREAGRDPATLRTVVLAYCLVTDDATVREQVAAAFVPYVATRSYAAMLARLGFAAQVERVGELFAARRRSEATAALAADLLDALVAVGSRAAVAERVRAFLEAGADTVVVYPVGSDDAAAMRTWRGAREALA